MIRILGFLAALAALTVTASVDAGGHQCVVQTQAVVATPVFQTQTAIVTPFIATTYVPIQYQTYIAVPTYSVSGYANVQQQSAAPAVTPAPSQCEQTGAAIKELANEFREQNKNQARQNEATMEILRRIGGGQVPQPLPPGPKNREPQQLEPLPGPAKTSSIAFAKGKTFVARCAGCHDKGVIDSKDVDPAKQPILFVNKQPIPLDPWLAGDCLEALQNGTMPKGQQITEEEFVDIAGSLRELRIARAPAAVPVVK